MEEMTETKTGLLSKKQDELTVGDAIKINLGAVAVVAAAYAVVTGAVVGWNKFSDWRMRRDMAKVLPAPQTESKEV